MGRSDFSSQLAFICRQCGGLVTNYVCYNCSIWFPKPEKEEPKIKEQEMGTRYFRCKRDNFLWKSGAILESCSKSNSDASGYVPVDKTTLWDATNHNGSEYISSRIIENNPDWFEEVWKINLVSSVVYKVKEEAIALINGEYRGG